MSGYHRQDTNLGMLNSRISRRDLLLRVMGTVLSLSVSGFALEACGSKGAVSTSSGTNSSSTATTSKTGQVKLDLWVQKVSIEYMKPASKPFEKAKPNIKLNWIPTPLDQTPTKLLAALSAGSGAPDTAFIQYTDMVKFTTRDGAGLVDLRSRIKKDNRKTSDWVDFAMDIVTTKSGKILGLPEDVGAEGTFYHRDVFEAASLSSEPEKVHQLIATWDDVLATGKEVTASGKYMLNKASDVFDIVRQQGNQAYFDEDGRPVVNSPEFVHAAEVALKMRKAKLDLNPANDAESGAGMKQGKVATYFSAAWFDIIIHSTALETKGKWGVTTLPEQSSANLGGSYFVLPQQGKHQQEAWEFISFLVASKRGWSGILNYAIELPGWKPAWSLQQFTAKNPFYSGQVWAKQFMEAAAKVPSIRLNQNDPIAADTVSHALTDILEHGANIKQRLDQANKQIEQRIRT